MPDEVIIGDDSENSNFEQAVAEFYLNHPTLPFELKYYRNPQQLGVNANFYSVAEKASGDIVFFCDQDDFWLPGKIEKFASVFEQNSAIDAVCCFSVFTDADLKPWALQDQSELNALNRCGKKTLFELFLKNMLSGAGHNIAIRKSILTELPVWGNCFLYDSWLLRSCAAAGSLKFIRERLTLHRVHGENLTGHPEVDFKRTVAMRMKKNGSAELSKLFSEWQEFEVNLNNSPYREKVTQGHRKSLQNCISYLERRIQYRSRPLFLRFIFSLLLLKDYFLFGNGFRSAVRDIADL